MRTGRPLSDLVAYFKLPYMKAFLAVLPEVLKDEIALQRCSMVTKITDVVSLMPRTDIGLSGNARRFGLPNPDTKTVLAGKRL